MNREKIYTFKNVNPDEKAKAYVAKVAEELYFAAPSDAGLDLVIEKIKNEIKASCRIASQVGVFTAEAIGTNVISAVEQIRKKIDLQLKFWKSQRFEHADSSRREEVLYAS